MASPVQQGVQQLLGQIQQGRENKRMRRLDELSLEDRDYRRRRQARQDELSLEDRDYKRGLDEKEELRLEEKDKQQTAAFEQNKALVDLDIRDKEVAFKRQAQLARQMALGRIGAGQDADMVLGELQDVYSDFKLEPGSVVQFLNGGLSFREVGDEEDTVISPDQMREFTTGFKTVTAPDEVTKTHQWNTDTGRWEEKSEIVQKRQAAWLKTATRNAGNITKSLTEKFENTAASVIAVEVPALIEELTQTAPIAEFVAKRPQQAKQIIDDILSDSVLNDRLEKAKTPEEIQKLIAAFRNSVGREFAEELNMDPGSFEAKLNPSSEGEGFEGTSKPKTPSVVEEMFGKLKDSSAKGPPGRLRQELGDFIPEPVVNAIADFLREAESVKSQPFMQR